MLAVYTISYGDVYRDKEKGTGCLSMRHLLSSDNTDEVVHTHFVFKLKV